MIGCSSASVRVTQAAQDFQLVHLQHWPHSQLGCEDRHRVHSAGGVFRERPGFTQRVGFHLESQLFRQLSLCSHARCFAAG